MRDLSSRQDHPRERVCEPDARRHPRPDTGRIYTPRDVRSCDGEDTQTRGGSPVRAVIGVEYRGISGAATVV